MFRGRSSRSLALALSVLVLIGALTWRLPTTRAGFTEQTSNDDASFEAGTVTVTDDDGGAAMFTVGPATPGEVGAADLLPGDSVENCVRILYTGSLAARLRMYVSEGGGTAPQGAGLLPYLRISVEEAAVGGFGCTGLGPTTVVWDDTTPAPHSDRLTDFPGSRLNALEVGPTSWTRGTARTYRVRLTLIRTVPDTAAGAQALVSFRWVAEGP